jgi:hypothetical protein
MKIILSIVCFFLVFTISGNSQEFKWVRVKFECVEPDAQEKWNIDPKADVTFLEHLEKYTTLKVDKTWNNVTLEKLEDIIKYPILFMTASGTPKLNEVELKNLKEYLLRGGILLADDSNWPAKGGNIFFVGMKKYLEEMFPKLKVEPLDLSHPLFHCHFDLPFGYYCKLWVKPDRSDKSPSGVFALLDEKGRIMVLFTLLLQNTWGGIYFNPSKQEEAIKMGINLVVYALTH